MSFFDKFKFARTKYYILKKFYLINNEIIDEIDQESFLFSNVSINNINIIHFQISFNVNYDNQMIKQLRDTSNTTFFKFNISVELNRKFSYYNIEKPMNGK